jgi:predicted PurR-regulated permease PerM
LYGLIKQLVEEGLMEPPAWVLAIPLAGKSLSEYWHLIANNHDEMVALTTRFLEPARDFLLASGMMLGQGIVEMSLSVFVCFFFYRDGVELMSFLNAAMIRIGGAHAENVLVIINQTVRSVMYGLIGTSVAQGVVATIGFVIAGVPGALMLGIATATLSLIPIGPPLIWGGAVIWLFYQGTVGWGIFMFLWGLILISGVDNMVLPLLLSRGSSLPFILILLGVMGGVIAFGFVGIFIGPTLLAVALSLTQQWAARPLTASQNSHS